MQHESYACFRQLPSYSSRRDRGWICYREITAAFGFGATFTVTARHILTVSSPLAETSFLPSGENATE